MTADQFVDEALRRGAREGMASLDTVQRVVFAISEAEVLCAMEGIDSLVDRYSFEAMESFAEAFSAIGAVDIAVAFRAIAQAPKPVSERLLTLANDLVNEHRGYGYEAIRAYVEAST